MEYAKPNPLSFNNGEFSLSAKLSLEESFSIIREAQTKGNFHMAVVYDRDETLVMSALKHAAVIRTAMIGRGYSPDILPTDDDVLRYGGTDQAFRESFPSDEDFAVYQGLVQQNRDSAEFNTNIPLADDRIPPILQETEKEGYPPVLCLTATPQHLESVVKTGITKDLHMNIPVIGKPIEVKLAETAQWKITILQYLAHSSERDIPILIVDDSMTLGRAIRDLCDPYIHCITLTGTLTNQDTMASGGARGLIRSDWENLPEKLETVCGLTQRSIQKTHQSSQK